MDAKRILNYLKQLMANNNREWYWANKAEYDAIRADFEEGIKLAIGRIADFDPSIAHLSVKDCTYRFNRDTQPTARRRYTEVITCTWSPAIVWWPAATTGCPQIS